MKEIKNQTKVNQKEKIEELSRVVAHILQHAGLKQKAVPPEVRYYIGDSIEKLSNSEFYPLLKDLEIKFSTLRESQENKAKYKELKSDYKELLQVLHQEQKKQR